VHYVSQLPKTTERYHPSNAIGIATHVLTFRLFNGLRFVLPNWFSGLPIPVPDMSLPASLASRLRLASLL
jgi:hypothetical protein